MVFSHRKWTRLSSTRLHESPSGGNFGGLCLLSRQVTTSSQPTTRQKNLSTSAWAYQVCFFKITVPSDHSCPSHAKSPNRVSRRPHRAGLSGELCPTLKDR